MSIQNTPYGGAANTGNTGIAPITFDPERIDGFFIIPKDAYLSESEMASVATVKAALQEKTTLNDRNQRWYPVHGIAAVALKNTDAAEYTYGYGQKRKMGTMQYGMTFTFNEGGMYRNANLYGFNGQECDIMFYDKNNKLVGAKYDSNQYGLTGRIETHEVVLADGSNPTLYMTTVYFDDPTELNDVNKISYIDCKNDINFKREVPGVVNLTLTEGTPAAGYAFVGVKTTDGNTNLYDVYDDEFASTAVWSAKKLTDGTAVAISAVAKNAATKEWKLSITYTGTVIISAAGPETLAANNIGGAPSLSYEAINTVTQELPAP